MKRRLSIIAGGAIVLLLTLPGMAQLRARQLELLITKNEILAVQSRLRQLGYYRSEPSGLQDRRTRAALRAFQSDRGLPVTGRIDLVTLEKLEISYPAGEEEELSSRRPGLFPKIGYGIKDGMTVGGEAATSVAKTMGRGVKTGVEKTTGVAGGIVHKTREVATDASETTISGARNFEHGARRVSRRASDALIGRSDAEISLDVREVLAQDPRTARTKMRVKDGQVTLISEAEWTPELDKAADGIRNISGVKKVFKKSELLVKSEVGGDSDLQSPPKVGGF